MKKTTITTKTIEELNEFFDALEKAEFTNFITVCDYNKKNNEFEFETAYDSEHTFKTTIENANNMNLYQIFKEIISEIYDDEINWLNRANKGYNAFLRRKAKSLILWNSRNNQIKVSGILTELTEMNNKIESNKKEIYIWKDIVRVLFKTIDGFCAKEKIADKKLKVQKQIDQLERIKDNDDIYFVG